MKQLANLVVVLTGICLVSGLLLAWVNDLTAEPILAAQRQEKLVAIKKVLPPCDNEPDSTVYVTETNGTKWAFYIATQAGKFVGTAFETSSTKGYGGTIGVMVGVTADGRVRGIEIVSQKETPGLGAKIADQPFKDQFADRDLATTKWAVKKDGGDIDQITAATISSRAVAEAVKTGLGVYTKNAAAILAHAASAPQQLTTDN